MCTRSGSLSTVCIQMGHKNYPLYGVAGCLMFRGCLSTEVNVKTVMTFGIVCYVMGVCR